MRAVNIEWDADKDVLDQLPKEMAIPPGTRMDGIEDYLSDKTGWCVFGFKLAPNEHIIEAKRTGCAFVPPDVAWRIFRLESPADLADVCLALYDRASDWEISTMENAVYPCWAAFTVDDEMGGRCEGTLADVRRRLNTWLDSAETACELKVMNDEKKDKAIGQALYYVMPGVILNDEACRRMREEYERLVTESGA